MKQNLSMQHERDLQIVRDEAQRKIDDAFSQARLSEEKAIAQSRKIEDHTVPNEPTVPTH